ncbi:MAG: FprA family A-type flavoprotein [bacterium]|jgi:flavorubredoxin|nr:FprA family A-type flavoprotein [candidate division KSB1 bacterium]MDH7559755.1 FprA family A-type flavoprotein [bacterium]
MKALELKPGIYWVGSIDWDLRNFHGYLTPYGSTYNAYLVVDEKVALVDTAKRPFFDELLARVRSVIDPARIDFVVCNHVEMDHSGSIPALVERAPKAQVLASPNGEKGLRAHFHGDLNYRVVRSGEVLSLGRRSLQCFHTPMVHWPDSMVTYLPEEAILFSNDAFGQHLATAVRFDDEAGWDLVYAQAAKYYANIVLPYGEQVKRALQAVGGLKIDMICPSHGVIWRQNIGRILEAYERWANHEADDQAVVVYDSMWGSTAKMAQALCTGLEAEGVPVTVRNLETTHISEVMTDLLQSRLVLVGSPTLNNGLLPSVGQFLTYLKGLRPRNRMGFAFGSYGWGGQAVAEIEEVFSALGWQEPVAARRVQWVPDEEQLGHLGEDGRALAKALAQK